MTLFECLSSNEKLRVALYNDVIMICNETCHLLGLEMSQSAMIIISELVYKKLTMYGSDLEAFANHANRTSIDTDDVRLLVRRNPSLQAHLRLKCIDKSAVVQKRRKTTSNINTSKKKKKKIENNNINLPSTSRDPPSPVFIE